MAWLTFAYCGVSAGRGISRVVGTGASTGSCEIAAGEDRTEVTVGISENWVARVVCAVAPVIHLMKVKSAATFLLCGLMYRFQPPMFEVPGEVWPWNAGSGVTPTLPTTLDGEEAVCENDHAYSQLRSRPAWPLANADIACGSWNVVTAGGVAPEVTRLRMNEIAFCPAAESSVDDVIDEFSTEPPAEPRYSMKLHVRPSYE